jgi:membrane protein
MPSDFPPEPETTFMELQQRAEEFRADLPSPSDLAERSGGWRPFARHTLTWMISGYRETQAQDLAASVAYYALLAIVPTVLALVSIIGFVLRTDDGYRQAVDLVLWVVPEGLTTEGIAALPSLRDRSGVFGLASIVGFLWIGSTFFAALGRAMNRVYSVPDWSPVQQRVRGLIGVVAFSLLFIISVVAAIVPTVVLGIDERTLPLGLERWRLFTGLYQALSYVVAVAVAMVLFAVIFRIVPAAGQRVFDIVPGAMAIGVAFVLLAQVFPLYLRIVQGWNLIGGTAGLLSLVLVWFYLLAHLFLFGAYINSTWQRHRQEKQERL